MGRVSTGIFAAVLAAAASGAAAHGVHHKPLAFEELHAVCQAYFKRAQACYAKADEKAALFHKGNTEFLRQSLPAATVKQREEMCKMADDAFADKAKALKCE